MKPISLQQSLTWIKGATLRTDRHVAGFKKTSYGVSTDTRTLRKDNLFIALKGTQVDSHQYLGWAQKNKAAAAIVNFDAPQVLKQTPRHLPYIVVPNTLVALQELAQGYRKQFDIPLAVVVGSNGKTTVKEMIASIFNAQCKSLGKERGAHSTVGNFNNEIGLPLTLLKLDPQHLYSVVELGMNHPGETLCLANIALPTIAVINNAQREHQEFMQTVDAVAQEHASVLSALPNDGIAVLPRQDAYYDLWRQHAGQRTVIDFALHTDANTEAAAVIGTRHDLGLSQTLTLSYQAQSVDVHLAVAGEHNARNALAACAVAIAAGISLDGVKNGLEAFNPVKGRMQLHHVLNMQGQPYTLIDDSYNANPDSVGAAIRVLDRLENKTILILGDMGEVGQHSMTFHQEAGQLAGQSKIHTLLTVGQASQVACTAFAHSAKNSQHFSTLEDLLIALKPLIHAGDTVLVKASRFMQLDKLVQTLLTDGQYKTEVA